MWNKLFISYLFNFSDLLEQYISLLVWRHSLGLSGWMMLSGAWALWRLCLSDFYQGKPIRPDRGMMILGHHHSGDTAPTNPTTPSSIRQPKTLNSVPSFSCSPLTLFLTFPSFSTLDYSTHSAVSCFHDFICFYCGPSLHFSPFLSLSPMANTKTNSALFLAHETFNISFQFLADASKRWPNESYLLSTLSAIRS